MDLKKSDLDIIEELKKNSRSSIRDIAKKTKLRPSTVHKRLQKLKDENVIEKFTVKLNNKAVGENFIVFMFVKTKPSQNINLSNNRIKEVFGITGEYDLLIKLKFGSVDEFNDYIIKFRREQPVVSTHTMVATANIKEEI